MKISRGRIGRSWVLEVGRWRFRLAFGWYQIGARRHSPTMGDFGGGPVLVMYSRGPIR